MTGSVVVIGDGLIVSNVAKISTDSEVIDTVDGRKVRNEQIIDISDPFGTATGNVEIAFKSDDGDKYSYSGTVDRCSDIRCIIKIKVLTENYHKIIRRAKEWQE